MVVARPSAQLEEMKPKRVSKWKRNPFSMKKWVVFIVKRQRMIDTQALDN